MQEEDTSDATAPQMQEPESPRASVPRLNPKLTMRSQSGQMRPAPPASSLLPQADASEEDSDDSAESDFDPENYHSPRSEDSNVEREKKKERQSRKEERAARKLLESKPSTKGDLMEAQKVKAEREKHSGKYIEKIFKVGRPVPLTGIWDCCGNTLPLSIWCESKESRIAMKKAFAAAALTQEELCAYRNMKISGPKAEWDSNRGTSSVSGDNISAEDRAMESAARTDSNFNAPMLSSWLYKNVHEEPTIVTGMAFLQQHLESGEGCELMLKHDIIGAIQRIHDFYKDHPPLQLQCVTAMRKMLECNPTRDRIISSTGPLRMVFNIAHVHMNSRSHVEQALRSITQFARSEIGRVHILRTRMYAYVVHWCKRFSGVGDILRPALRLFNWVATDETRIRQLCSSGGVIPVILRVMKKNMTNSGVLGSGMLFLTRASKCHPPAMNDILKLRATPMVIRALSALYADESLQLEGLKMIQTISKTAEGWKQITETRGGWQSITQGTVLGNALVHDLPGLLHNPGWAIGDTPNLPVTDQQRNKANAIFQNASKGVAPKVSWTAHGLRDFMGISMKETKLAVNSERHDTYFDLLSTLELLPTAGEEREYWFIRIKDYEIKSNVLLDDMVNTMIDLKHKEILNAKKAMEAALLPPEDAAKEVFVLGQLVTTKMLSETDLSLQDIMRNEK